MPNNRIIKQLAAYFFRGLLLTAPIFITFYIIIASLQWIDHLLPFDFPGLGVIIILGGITVLGFFASTLLAKPFLEFLDTILGHTPLVNIIYGSIKDVVNAFVGDNKKFKNPVLVTLEPVHNIKRIGFITETDLSKLGQSNDMIAVYVPDSYGLTGNLFIVPKKSVEELPIPVSEVMKFIVSGGVSGLNTKATNEKDTTV